MKKYSTSLSACLALLRIGIPPGLVKDLIQKPVPIELVPNCFCIRCRRLFYSREVPKNCQCGRCQKEKTA